MTVYYNPGRWRHGGLQGLLEGTEEEIFLSVEDWHEQVQINLGPNVGDITTEYKPPRRGRVIPVMSYSYWSPWRQGVWRFNIRNLKAPGPKGGLGPVDINRHMVVDLCCKIRKGRNRAGHSYETAGILWTAGRQPVYIKGWPGGGLRQKNQIESQA